MNRLHRCSLFAGLVLVAGLLPVFRGQEPPPKKEKIHERSTRGQEPPKEKKTEEKLAEKWDFDRALTVTSAPAPVPALKYRLFPLASERKDGNAVPIYLRFAQERPDAWKQQQREKPAQWNKLPLDKLPLQEAKQFLHGWKGNLRGLELGAWRKTADWGYPLDDNPLELLLPDLQEMRFQAPLLVVKARVEIAEKRPVEALHTLAIGFSFSHQVADAPALISGIVGVACANEFADCLVELLERPETPNLYWALTALPRPFIDLCKSSEFTQRALEMQFPILTDLDRPRTAEQWDAELRRFRKEYTRIFQFPSESGYSASDPAAKSPDLPAAQKYLIETLKLPAAEVKTMPSARMLLLYLAKHYRQLSDDLFKAMYLPYPQARSVLMEADRRRKEAPDSEVTRLGRALLSVGRFQLPHLRLERKLAALRAIEALRMHAAAHGGQLPDKLDEVKVAPVPNDPGTGQPFEYQRDGRSATLISRIPGEPLDRTGLRYRLTIRK